ncbi:heat-shock protein Hsp20 [Anoxybacter fermentans]|uniref:Heat-shock protein Hsp20 n=1 Tax=Anoxybacter fermentans TaxID=1323375 RepID=A0A3S9SYB9_9FIRM|nr:Hsp20/alpha crystallin family protein [Anoxybacter fermentans]AZR73248.1 heat-shock protein Hsp20 [Anoxybacter fermentans]
MALIPYEPFRQLEQWRRDLDRFFTDFPNPFGRDFNLPRIDVYETDNEVVVECEIPGIEKKEDINIDVDENIVTISGTINRYNEIREDQMHRRERFTGRFQRSVALPTRVSVEGTTATYKNGILEVRMPKAAQETRKRIDVKFQ